MQAGFEAPPAAHVIKHLEYQKMRRRTDRALLLSLAFHIILIFLLSPFFINDFDAAKEGISAEILAADPEKRIRRRVLPPRIPLMPRVADTEADSDAIPTSTSAPRVSAPKAPVHADVVPDVVTHAALSQTDQPSAVSNTSFGDDKTLGGPVVINRHTTGKGDSGTNIGFNGPERRNSNVGTRFIHETGVSDIGLEIRNRVGTGLGIFGTEVMAGHGLIGQVFVPGTRIFQMPDFERLIPIYTFLTADLNVPTRNYTEGFPTPEMQSVVEDFAIRFRAELRVDVPGIYTFELYSDDGSQLYINGKLVVDNDGIHATIGRQGSMRLGTGMHPVEIHYFQGPRHAIALQWLYQPPHGYMQIVPPNAIYRSSKPQAPDELKKLQQRLSEIREKKIENIREQ